MARKQRAGNKTILQTIVVILIEQKPVGAMFTVWDLYAEVRKILQAQTLPGNSDPKVAALSQVLKGAASRGGLPSEPRYKNDVRWAIRYAREAGLIRHHGTPRSGEWRRA